METVLTQYYNIFNARPIQKYDNCFIDNEEYVYSITSLNNNEVFYEEQNSLAKFCIEQGYESFMQIIPNSFGQIITSFKEQNLLVSRGRLSLFRGKATAGRELAQFHLSNYLYPFEPRYESSYGKWQELWIEKLSFFEREIKRETSKDKGKFLIKARNILPYIIGISENAIQYLQENKWDHQFTQVDRGTICFRRYKNQLNKPFIPLGNLVYDHPVRDISEVVRQKLLHSKNGPEESLHFLMDYHYGSALSLYSFKLLYARLLYPVHFFDLFYKQLFSKKDYTTRLEKLKNIQNKYEEGLRRFFELIERNYETLPMHMIQWL